MPTERGGSDESGVSVDESAWGSCVRTQEFWEEANRHGHASTYTALTYQQRF
jgi:hypothetical protein